MVKWAWHYFYGNSVSKTNGKTHGTLSYYQIFRYATWLEAACTALGVLLGLLSASGLCVHQLLTGDVITAMVQRTSKQNATSSPMAFLQMFGGGRVLTNASNEENMNALVEDGLAWLAAASTFTVLSIIFCFASVFLVNWSAAQQVKRIRLLFLKAVLRQDMAWYDTDVSFNFASRMSEDLVNLSSGMGEKLAIASNLLGSAFACVIMSVVLNWRAALAGLCVAPLAIAAVVMFLSYQAKFSMLQMDAMSKAGKHVEEVLRSVRTVVAFEGETDEINRYKNLLEVAKKYGYRRALYRGLGAGFNFLLIYIAVAIVLAYGVHLLMEEFYLPLDERKYTLGRLYSIMQCFNLGLKSVAYFIPHAETFATAKGAAANIFKILNLNPQIDGLSKSGLSPRHVKGEISLENVTFSYPSRPEIKVLKDFSLTVRAGETVALVGASGCGKSTILQLIQRLYDAQSGAVKVDGNCVKTLNLEWLRSSLGIVGQEPVLFRGSILDNIMIVSPGASREQVERVARIAFAHEFIINLPNGYDTLIGERGLSLSGGQKQRIAIARALLREPGILLLDEATSALDPRSEVKVQEALDRASENRTTVIVSHRLSTIVNADRIVCMDKGAIVEMGTHDELISLKGHYWKLVMTEKSKTEPDIIGHVGDAETSEFDLTLSSEEQNTNVIRRLHKKRGSEESKSIDSLHMKVLNEDNETNDQKEEDKSLSTFELLKLNRKEWYLLVIGIGAAVIQGWVHTLTAIVLSYAVESFTKNDPDVITSNCTFYAILFVAIGLLALLTNVIQTFSLPRSSSRMCTRLRLQLFWSFLKQDMSFYDQKSNSIGSLTTKLSRDMGEVSSVTGLMLGSIADGLSATSFGLLIGLIFSWKVALVGATFVPIVMFCIKLETMARKNSAALERSSMETANALASEAVSSIRTVQSLAIEKVFLEKVEKSSEQSIRASLAGTRWRGLVFGIGQYAPYICYMLCVMVGIYLIKNEDEYFVNVLISVRSIIGSTAILSHAMVFLPQFNSAKGSCARVLSLIRQEPKVRTEDGVVDPADWTATGEFKLSNVEFSYPSRPREPVLSGFDLKVEAGKTVALVGPSGCGKSTVLQLLQRFYDPDSGVIELDYLNTRSQLSLPRLRRQLGVVQQEPVLFDRTLAENISYGDHARAVSMQDVVEAAKAANIHSFISSLPKGYDTPLGSSGAQLSGGQKQRVCIARALIRSPRLLLLDEATSALDASSEQAVSDALDAAAVGRTCVTIAHRLTTVQNADVICVVDEHKIVEKGSHAELMQLKGRYWKMTGGHKKKSPSQPQPEESKKE